MLSLERHLFVILLWVSAGVSFVAHVSSGGARLGVAAGLLGVLALWIHPIHRVHSWTADQVDSTRYVVATAGLIAALAALTLVEASYLFLLFGVFSFVFGYSTNLRLTAVVSGALTAIWIALWVYLGLPTGAIITPIFVWGVANGVNVLSTRISRQNVERGELIDRLNATRHELAVAERERGVLEERSRLAREIHDTLAQGFTSVVLVSEAMQAQIQSMPREQMSTSLTLLASTARENLDEARRLIAAEAPPALDDRSLSAALETLAADLQRRSNATVAVDAPLDCSLGGTEEVVLFRVAQEACTNIAKHANANHVQLTLELNQGLATLTVSDDGQGFPDSTDDTSAGARLTGGSGLGFMGERLTEVDGELDVHSDPGVGTVVRASIPIASAP